TLGSYPTMTLATAIAEHRKLADALAAGTDPATAVRASRDRQASADDTTTAYVETFKVQHVAQLAENTQSYMIAELDRMVDAFGSKAIADVTPADVQKVIDAAITRGPSAQRTSWRVARAFFNWAAPRMGKPSPCEHLRKLSKDDVRERYLDNDE